MGSTLQEEITKEAYMLYEKSGRQEGNELLNWLSAEKIVHFNRMILSEAMGGAFALLEYKPLEASQGTAPKELSRKTPKSVSFRSRKNAAAGLEQGI
jgi:hypothetical protein